jgi:hypothetical protein
MFASFFVWSYSVVANYLVSQHNVPFRQAHHIVGSLVGDLSRAGKNFRDLDTCLNHIIVTHKIPADREKLKKVFDSKQVMLSYNSQGGTGPKAVQQMMDDMHQALARHKKVCFCGDLILFFVSFSFFSFLFFLSFCLFFLSFFLFFCFLSFFVYFPFSFPSFFILVACNLF